MLCLAFVVLGTSVGLVNCYNDMYSVLHLEGGAKNFKENSGFQTNRRPRLVDVYTNFPDKKVVEDSFYRNYNRRNTNRDMSKYSELPVDRKDTLSFQHLDDMFSSPEKDVLSSEHGELEADIFYDGGSNSGSKKPEYFEEQYYDAERNNYDYSHNPLFITKNKHQPITDKDRNNYVFLQSQLAVPDSENFGSYYPVSDFNSEPEPENSKPHFLTIKRPNFIGRPQNFQNGNNVNDTAKGHIQKIPLFKKRSTTVSPKMSGSGSNKYEEVDLSHSHHSQDKNISNTKRRIGDLLKKYLATVFVEKYADKKVDQHKPISENSIGFGNNQYSGFQNISDPKIPKINQESKFFDTDTLWALKNKTIAKIKNLFSIFTVIKFNNTECNATNWAGTWQGLCYTSGECDDMNGTALGNCASGYGVCCVFRGTCDDSSSRNCSYFKSPNYPDYYPSDGTVIIPTTTAVAPTNFPTPDPRFHFYYYNHGNGDQELDNLIRGKQDSEDISCTFSVFKSDPEVNQIRIDFIDLELASPTNGTCTAERLVISGQNANDQIPVLCGYNTGQHVYVDVSELEEPLQLMVLSKTNTRKRFKLRICQYTDSCSTSQSNCLQYYTGVSGVIQSFNYDQADMLNRSRPGYFNNLNYAICIRRESGYCSVTYMNVRNGQTFPFQLVNRLPNGQVTIPSGQAGVDILNCPDDYIIIDGTRLCGDRFNDGSTVMNFSRNAPVTDTSAGPIVLNVRTNGNVTGLGFKLYYRQNPCPDTDK